MAELLYWLCSGEREYDGCGREVVVNFWFIWWWFICFRIFRKFMRILGVRRCKILRANAVAVKFRISSLRNIWCVAVSQYMTTDWSPFPMASITSHSFPASLKLCYLPMCCWTLTQFLRSWLFMFSSSPCTERLKHLTLVRLLHFFFSFNLIYSAFFVPVSILLPLGVCNLALIVSAKRAVRYVGNAWQVRVEEVPIKNMSSASTSHSFSI